MFFYTKIISYPSHSWVPWKRCYSSYLKRSSKSKKTLKIVKGYVQPINFTQKTVNCDPKVQNPSSDSYLEVLKRSRNLSSPISLNDPIQTFQKLVESKTCSSLTLQDWHKLIENILKFDWSKKPIPTQIRETIMCLVREMKQNGVQPDAFVYRSLIKVMSDDKKEVILIYKYVKKQVLEEKIEHPVLVNNTFIQTLLLALREKYTGHGLDNWFPIFWEDLKEFKITPTMETCVEFLKCPQILKHPKIALDIHQLLKYKKSTLEEPWNVTIYELLMRVHLNLHHYDAVKKLFFEMIQEFPSLSRHTYAYFLSALLELKDYDGILTTMNRMRKSQEFVFSNTSVGICLKALLHTGKYNEMKSLCQEMESAHESGLNGLDYRMYHEFIFAFSRANDLKMCLSIYNKYISIRKEEAELRNQERQLMRPTLKVVKDFIDNQLYKVSWDGKGIFPHDYMPPEAPRHVLASLAYAYGRSRSISDIQKFFDEIVFDMDRLLLYYTKQLHSSHMTLADSVQKLHPNDETRQKMLSSSKSMNLEKFSGKQGPLAQVYASLEEGWRVSIENLEEKGDEILQLEDLMQRLLSREDEILSLVI